MLKKDKSEIIEKAKEIAGLFKNDKLPKSVFQTKSEHGFISFLMRGNIGTNSFVETIQMVIMFRIDPIDKETYIEIKSFYCKTEDFVFNLLKEEVGQYIYTEDFDKYFGGDDALSNDMSKIKEITALVFKKSEKFMSKFFKSENYDFLDTVEIEDLFYNKIFAILKEESGETNGN